MWVHSVGSLAEIDYLKFFFFFFYDLNSEAWQAGPDREAGFFMWSSMLGFQVDKDMSFQNSHKVVFATFCCSK